MEKEGGQLINVSQIHQTDIFQGFCFYHFVLPKVPFVTLIFDFQFTCNFLFTINSKFSHPCLPIRIYLWSSLYPFVYPFIPASPSRSISGPPFTALQPGAGNKIQVATVSQTNHAPEYQVQLSCSNYFTTACMYTFNNGRKDLQFHKNRLAALDCSAIVTSLAGWVSDYHITINRRRDTVTVLQLFQKTFDVGRKKCGSPLQRIKITYYSY